MARKPGARPSREHVKWDKCLCGNEKHARSKTCRPCFEIPPDPAELRAYKAKWAREHRAYDSCACGGRRVATSTMCNKCAGRKAGLTYGPGKRVSTPWYERNKKKAHDATVAWQKRNPEKVKASSVKTREKYREKYNALSAAWSRAHPESRRVNEANRRARKRNAPGRFTIAEFEAICDGQLNRCFDCGCKPPKLTVGHMVPLIRGGSNFPSNIVGQCVSCNARQHDRIHPSLMIECNLWAT